MDDFNANDLIGCRYDPSGHSALQALRIEARAYHKLNPYPWFHFKDWRTESRGPLPRCLPFVNDIVRDGAKWLFGDPPSIVLAADAKLEKYLSNAWTYNRMPAKMVTSATHGGLYGGTVLKFDYDSRREVCQLRFTVLSLLEHCHLFFHPHDRDKIAMARIQFTAFDPRDGKYYWYREEFTEDYRVEYEPVLARPRPKQNPWALTPYPQPSEWVEKVREPNKLKVIPLTLIRNIDSETEHGVGDLWDCYRIVDRVNLTYHLMDRSNQFDSEPNKVFIDADMQQEDVDRPLAPGEDRLISSTDDAKEKGQQAKVQVLEPKGFLRPAMSDYVKDLKGQIRRFAGSVDSDPELITNKGNLTSVVMKFIFAPLISATQEKRKTYGEDGICKFLENVCVGLKNLGVPEFKGVRPDDLSTYDVQLKWPPYFEPTEDEKQTLTNTTAIQVEKGYITQERAIERVASAEGIQDVNTLKEELAKQPPPAAPQPDDEEEKPLKMKRGGRFERSGAAK